MLLVACQCPHEWCDVFMKTSELFAKFLGSLMYTIISSENNESLMSSFPIQIPLISLCCLIAIARTSSTILKRYGESGQPCRVPDFNGMALSFSPFNLILAVDLLYIAFIIFRHDPCIPNLSKTFIIKGC